MKAKIVMAILSLVLSTLLSVWVLSQGWGLQVHSWPTIIAGAFIQFVLISALRWAIEE